MGEPDTNVSKDRESIPAEVVESADGELSWGRSVGDHVVEVE